MKTFNVNGNLGRFEVSLPETLDEISTEYLKKCTDFINPAPNYAVVGIVYKDSLSLVLTSAKKNKPTQISVIPVFIKTGKTDSEFINSLSLGDKCVVAASDLSIGHHINSPYNKITPENVIRLCDGDKEIYSKAIMLQTPVCFLEFKLIPVSAIHASLEKTPNEYVNPFVHKDLTNKAEA